MKKIKTLATLISASLASNANQDTIILDAMMDTTDTNNISNISVLNKSVSHRLAAHRSHSSHRSHRSSSGGGGSSRPAPSSARSYSTPAPSQSSSYGVRSSTHDPLGQQARPKQSYPSKKKTTQSKADIKKIIMQVQLTLMLEGLYNGKVDGIMGEDTRKAIRAFKRKNNITTKVLLGAETLNALGVKGF